jgi:hypothetical protein
MDKTRTAYNIVIWKPEGKISLKGFGHGKAGYS